MPSEKMRLIHSFRGAECESITSRSDLWRPCQLMFLNPTVRDLSSAVRSHRSGIMSRFSKPSRGAHVTDDSIPLFTSEQWPAYRHALLHTDGAWDHPPRQGRRGAYPTPQQRPPPSLQYAQVVKRREGGRMVQVSTRVVFGTPEAVAASLAHSPVSSTVNTSFVERDNLTQRQSNRRLTRRTNGFSKDLTWFEKQLWLSLAYYPLVLPHQGLRERLPTPEPTRGAGSPRTWRPVTPAMAAGLTDHVWTTEELLAYRVPAEFLDQLRTIEHLLPAWKVVHHSN